MAGKSTELGPIGVNVTHTVRRLREDRGLGYADMSRQLAAIGRDIPPLGLRRIESGERRVDADDLVALAILFDVSPLVLLLPREAGLLTSQGEEYSLQQIWTWGQGLNPLPRDGAWPDQDLVRRARFLTECQPLFAEADFYQNLRVPNAEGRSRGDDQ